jgi:hypothetical protein
MTLFTTTNYPIGSLIEDIHQGKIGLPELQRPFVWPNVNVRNLFDSLYRGFPAGFLLFWDTGADAGLKAIGTHSNQTVPKLAIVDGQQRLTSLYAVLKGAEVLREDFSKQRIRIAFNPLLERFEVADAAILKDKAFIPDISDLWKPGTKLISFAKEFVGALRASRELTLTDESVIEESISRLFNLPQYQFVALTLGASVDARTIAEVFVRINGEGKKLNQSDFVMTLMSVFWDEGRAELENFARMATLPTAGGASPYNHYIRPSPDQLLRVTVGLGMKRARLENVYGALKGKDVATGLDDPVKRTAQFGLMQDAQKVALNLANWHHFLTALNLAGYRGAKMITSETAIIYCYVLYLIGARDYKVDRSELRQVVAEFFFMVSLTGRYSNSPETRFESDLALVRNLADSSSFVQKLRTLCSTTLTRDFWDITLPSQLATSAARSPSLFAYSAALVKLGATALFSNVKISDLADPAIVGTKSQIERHHLFPKAYLDSLGVKDVRETNQIANFAWLEWPDNLKIGAEAPAMYVPQLDSALVGETRKKIYEWHALPTQWWTLPYAEFLAQRRALIAKVIEQAWLTLMGKSELPTSNISISDLIAGGESPAVEFKSTLRKNLHTGQIDEKIQLSSLKTIAGFLNAKGGTLLIGVADDSQALGLESDGFASEDKMSLHLVNLVKERLGDIFMPFVHPHFEDQDGKRILVVKCETGPKPAFVKDGAIQRFFVRGGNATTELSGNGVTDYVAARFK